MSPLAVRNSEIINLKHFDIENFFYTDSPFFKLFCVKEYFIVFVEKILALLLLIFLFPLFVFVAAMIYVTMGPKVIYSQLRVGRNGKEFLIYKFRTMMVNAERLSGPVLATTDDKRVTDIGKILRASHLDELPQLYNVLKDDMSFIGPRPERPEFVKQFSKEIQDYEYRHIIRPGITGLAQICLPYNASAKDKLEYDRYYIDNSQSLFFNIFIGLYTGFKMLTFFRE
jgi:lipopolysaccharide/colanic/teichoic acid biosynthesis glycosyltransferase